MLLLHHVAEDAILRLRLASNHVFDQKLHPAIPFCVTFSTQNMSNRRTSWPSFSLDHQERVPIRVFIVRIPRLGILLLSTNLGPVDVNGPKMLSTAL